MDFYFVELDTAFGRLVVVLRGQACQHQTSLSFKRMRQSKWPSNSTIIDII
jgi:hypothetical protein